MTAAPAASASTPSPPIRRRWLRRAIWLAVLAALVGVVGIAFGVGFGRDPAAVRSALLNKPAPALRGTTLDGARLDLASYRGKVVLVNMWASWCAACRREHPVLTAAQRAYAGRGLQVIGVDVRDDIKWARQFLTEMGGAAFPSIPDPQAQIAVEWGTLAVPETYIVDRTGVIREKAVGAVTTQWVQDRVVPMLDPP